MDEAKLGYYKGVIIIKHEEKLGYYKGVIRIKQLN